MTDETLLENTTPPPLEGENQKETRYDDVSCKSSSLPGLSLYQTWEPQSGDLAEIFKALSHPIRLKMFLLLSGTEETLCACEFENFLPIKQPTISHHLKILKESGLIESWQKGLWVHYKINDRVLKTLGDFISILQRRENPVSR